MRKRQQEYLALGILIAIVSVIQLFWTRADRVPMPVGDSYSVLINLLKFLDGFGAHVLGSLWQELDKLSHLGRPPLYQILTIPSVLLFGRSEDAALTVNVIFLALLLIAVYNIGRIAQSGRAGLLAAFLIATYPPVVNLSRTYLPHFAAVACCALSLWLMLRLVEERSVRSALLFGLSLALGLWMHPYFGVAMLGPTVLVGFYVLLFQTSPRWPTGVRRVPGWLFEKLRDRLAFRGLLGASVIVIALVAPWYLTWGLRSYGIVDAHRQADLCLTFGFRGTECSPWWYLKTAPGALSNVLVALAIIGLVFALVKKKPSHLILAATLIVTYLSLRGALAYAWMIGALMLPAVAALTAVWIVGLRSRWLARSVLWVAVTVGLFNFSLLTWGATSTTRPIARVLGSHLEEVGTCLGRYAMALCPTRPGRDWRQRDILRQLLEDPSCGREGPCRLTIIEGYWSSTITASIQFQLAVERASHRVSVLPIGFNSRVRYSNLDLLTRLHAEYVLYPYLEPSTHKGSPQAAAIRFLRSPPAAFEQAHQTVAVFDLPIMPPNRGAEAASTRLVKRTRDLTGSDLESSAGTLGLSIVDAPRVYARVAEQYLSTHNVDRAFAIYLELTEGKPRAALRRRLIASSMPLGQHDRLITLHRDLLKLQPDDLTARTRLGESYRKTGRIDAAVVELERAIALGTGNPWPLRVAAEIYRRRSNFERAIMLYREILALDPEDVVHRVRLGEAYGKTGEVEQAVIELEKAMASAPENPWPRRARADLHRSQGAFDQAIPWYREALRIAPEDAIVRDRLVEAYLRVGDFEQALALDPDDPRALRQLAEKHRSGGELDRTVALYLKLLALEPHDVTHRVRLGQVYGELGEVGKAVIELERAVASAPGDVWPLRTLADLHRSRKSFDQAIVFYRQALTADPEDRVVRVRLADIYRQIGDHGNALALDPDNPRSLRQVAEEHRSRGDLEPAIGLYRRLVVLEPDNLTHRMRLGDAYRENGDVEAAITEFEQAIVLQPDNLWPMRVLAGLHYARKNFGRAIGLYQRLLVLDSGDVMHRVRLGEAYGKTGEVEQAVIELEQAMASAPEKPWARRALADLYQSQGDFDRAIHLHREALRIAPEDTVARDRLAGVYVRVGDLEQALALDPDNPRSLRRIAEKYRSRGELDRAVDLHQRLLTLEPSDPMHRVRLARVYGELGEVAKAEAEIEQALAAAPEDAGPLRAMADLHRSRRHFDQAIVLYRKALRVDPDDRLVRARLADAYRQTGDHGNALALEPDDLRSLRQVAEEHRSRGELEQALGLYRRLVTLAPDDLVHRTHLGEAYDRTGHREQAIVELQQVIAVDPDFSPALSVLANLHRKTGQFEKAVKLYRRLVALHPDHSNHRAFLGLAYSKTGKKDKAISMLEAASALAPNNSLPLLLLGDTYRGLGRGDDATRLYLKALDLAPGDPLIRLRLMQGYANQGEIDASLTELEKLMAALPDHPWLRDVLSQTLDVLSARNTAFDAYRQRLEPAP